MNSRLVPMLVRIVALFVIAGVAGAQERSLYWDALTVHARLDGQGLLHVTERHAMVFDGPWNGGERSFQLRSWQRLDLRGVSEVDPSTQARIPLAVGDLDSVGEYQRSGNVLRWRARMPDDPPFVAARKVYEIDYTLSGALIEEQGVYRLEHDLAFPNRSGEIRVFDAVLDVDPVWETEDLPPRWHHENLQPGESVFARANFRFAGTERPSAVASSGAIPSVTAAPALRHGLLIALVAFALVHTFALVRRERGRGRFEPALSLDTIDEAWLEANVFNRPPEVVGAAWDLDTSASEVSALLARLAQAGALSSEVRTTGSGWFKRETLSMELLCDRDRLADHERELIDALFFNGSRTTDTERIRERYSKRGFTPAGLIKKGVEEQLPVVFRNKIAVPGWARWLTALLFVAGVVAFIASAIRVPDAAPTVVVSTVVLFALLVLGLVFGYVYRTNVHRLRGRLARVLICVALLCGAVAFVLVGGRVAIVPLGAVSLTLLGAAFMNMIFNIMRTRETQEALTLRRQLSSARQYFERELRAENPRLKDEWFPYLLAFGLGPKIDRWFKSFGGERRARRARFGAGTMASSTGSRSAGSSTPSWTGGGGTFGGAGASATWAAAVGSIASGVAKPSSSGGGGRSSGGGSSSSSGGGGGGGW